MLFYFHCHLAFEIQQPYPTIIISLSFDNYMIFLNKHLPLGLFTCPASQTFQVEIFSEMPISHHSVMWSNTQRVTTSYVTWKCINVIKMTSKRLWKMRHLTMNLVTVAIWVLRTTCNKTLAHSETEMEDNILIAVVQQGTPTCIY